MAKVTPFIFGAWGYFGHLLVCLLLFCHHSFSLDSETEESLLSKSEESEIESDSESAANGEIVPIDMGDIRIGDFALVWYDYSRLVKYYFGECVRKDEENNGVTFIFLERMYGTLFKYRENVIHEDVRISMIAKVLPPPTTTRRGGKMDFQPAKQIIHSVKFLYWDEWLYRQVLFSLL